MKVSGISFKRNLTTQEQVEYKNVLNEARNSINGGGKSILIVHDACLPQQAITDTGVGHLTSKSAGEFFDFAKNRMGINTIELLPQGDMSLKHNNGFYNGYNGSALSLGTHEIDLELLTEPKFHSILPKTELQNVVRANAQTQKTGFVNYENVVGNNSPHEKALRIAFDNFKKDESIDKTAFEAYKKSNADWLEPKSLYQVIRKENGDKPWKEWTSELDKALFDKPDAKATERIATLKKTAADELEFYKFKQYMADEHLKLGRQELNGKNMRLMGDCLIGFSDDETWAFKSAFKKDTFIGDKQWGLPALNYDKILDEKSPAQKLLKRKVGLFAQRYDDIRFDCSWCYVKPKLSDNSSVELKGSLLDIIEDTVKSVQGEKFSKANLVHEFEADPKDFAIFTENGKILPYLKDRIKVISSAHLSQNYGSADAMKKAGASVDEYVIGVGNHDPQPLRQIADNVPEEAGGKMFFRKKKQAEVLEDILGIRKGTLDSPAEFSKAKFAEPLTAKNQMVFYMDALGRSERFDSQELNGWKNYRYRIPVDYAQEYERNIQNGFGYNPMDAYAKAFKAKGLHKTKKTLYDKIVKFRDIVQEKAGAAIEKAKNSTPLKKNKLFNALGIVLALGIIGMTVSTVQKQLEEQRPETINLKK